MNEETVLKAFLDFVKQETRVIEDGDYNEVIEALSKLRHLVVVLNEALEIIQNLTCRQAAYYRAESRRREK